MNPKIASKKRTVTSNNNNNNINNEYNLQREYVSAIIGKDVQLDCKMKNLAHDDDKVNYLYSY